MQTAKKNITLHELEVGMRAEVRAFSSELRTRRRLSDLGFVPGAEVCPLYQNASGSLKAYLVGGAVIALRADTTDKIYVEKVCDETNESVSL